MIPSVFSESKCSMRNTPLHSLVSFSRQELNQINFVSKNLPALEYFLKREDIQSATWDIHLRNIGHLLCLFDNVNSQEMNLFNLEKNKNPNYQMTLVDLKILADIIFNYDSESLWNSKVSSRITFFPITCSAETSVHCQGFCSCLSSFVQNRNCYSVFCSNEQQDFYWDKLKSMLEIELKTIHNNLSSRQGGCFLTQPLFLCCKTSCCQVIHKMVALVIVRKPDSEFEVFCFDSFNQFSLFNPVRLRTLIDKEFSSVLNVLSRNHQQIVSGTSGEFSGVLVLADAKLMINFVNKCNSEETITSIFNGTFTAEEVLLKVVNKWFPILKSPSSLGNLLSLQQSSFRDFLIKMTFKFLLRDLLLNFQYFSDSFCSEKASVFAVEKSFISLDYFAVKKGIEEEQKFFETFFLLLSKQNFLFDDVRSIFTSWNTFKNSARNFCRGSSIENLMSSSISYFDWKFTCLKKKDYSSIINASPFPFPKEF